MWEIRQTRAFGPRKWEWVCMSSAYGLIMGYAWTRWGAQRKLLRAEQELYSS